jgi:hypothetical protein
LVAIPASASGSFGKDVKINSLTSKSRPIDLRTPFVASSSSVTIVTDDEEATKGVLKSMGRDFEVNELILTSLPNKPGALAGMTTKLSDAGVNIKSFYIMKMELDVADVALTTDNPSKTKEILGI